MSIDLSKFSKAANGTTQAPPLPVSAMTGNVLDGVSSAAVYDRGIPLESGSYTVNIDVVKLFPSRQKAGHVFVVEMLVEETFSGTAKPGDRRAWVQFINPQGDVKQRPIALGMIKAFILAAVNPGTAAEKATVIENLQEIILGAASDSQDLKGYKVRATSSALAPKNPGDKAFQQVQFHPA